MADSDGASVHGSDDLSVSVREGAPGAPPYRSVPRVVVGGVVRSDVSVASQGASVLGMNSNFRTTLNKSHHMNRKVFSGARLLH